MAVNDGTFNDVEVIVADYPTGITDNSASNLVNERFAQATDIADEAIADAERYLSSIETAFLNLTYNIPSSDVSFDRQEISLTYDIESKRPESPTDAQLTVGPISDPGSIVLDDITLNVLQVPSESITTFDDDFIYSDPSYSSSLANAIDTVIQAWVEDGGTGLDPEVEAAIYTRARARTETAKERVYDEAENFFAARGWTIPPGALSGRLAEAGAEQSRADEQINYEILIAQGNLAQTNTHFAVTSGIQKEATLMESWNRRYDRLNDSLKFAFTAAIEKYKSQILEYDATLRFFDTSANVEKIQTEGKVSVNAQRVAEYTAKVDKYRADTDKELRIVENVARVYGYKVDAFRADAQVASSDLNAQVKEFDSRIQQAVSETSIALKEAEIGLQAYLQVGTLSIESSTAGANIQSQIAAGALSMVNAGASISSGTSHGYSESLGHSTSISNSASLGETHSYQEV